MALSPDLPFVDLPFVDLPFVVGDPASLREAWRLRAAGLIRPVLDHPAEVLAGSHLPPSPALRAAALAAALGAGPHAPAAFGFRTAAWIHAGGGEPGVVEIVTSRPGRRSATKGVRWRRVPLPAGQVQRLGGVRVTTPARTAADLARDLRPDEALAWLERLRARTTPAEVIAALDATPRTRHSTRARRLISRWS